MKDFDTERRERELPERSFAIGGETFTYRTAVAPEALLPWFRMRTGELLDLSQEEQIGIYDETVLAFLAPGQEARWAKARDPKAELPLNLADIVKLIDWLFEEQSGRPTGQESDSSPGSSNGATTTPSKDESDSVAVPV